MIDTVLAVLQDHSVMAVAFALWAYVVFYFGQKILIELRVLSTRLGRIEYYHANRITKIEAHLESHSDHNFVPYRNGETRD